jgi:hypothetical protein
MQGPTAHFIAQNAGGDFKYTEMCRCTIGVSESTTLILYECESTDDDDFTFYELEIVNVADGVNHSQTIRVDGANVIYIANSFEDAFMSMKKD